MEDLEIPPGEVKARIERGEKLFLIDVREPWEHAICRIEGATLIPMASLAASLPTLPDADEVICYCHHGMRSMDAAAWLRFQGFTKAKSLAGGIERWSREIDATVPRY
ncbi:MAG TPA: rhodanese-like domain-containing protein [Candidatus Angelobacter sp.]|nr:rhodanese-like domain-containing protein [Candidatus Angelobacter sp.]